MLVTLLHISRRTWDVITTNRKYSTCALFLSFIYAFVLRSRFGQQFVFFEEVELKILLGSGFELDTLHTFIRIILEYIKVRLTYKDCFIFKY